jgi:hypothetical protein
MFGTARNLMSSITQFVTFDDEEQFQRYLAEQNVGAKSTADDLRRQLDAGTSLVVTVPEMPRRKLVKNGDTDKLDVVPIEAISVEEAARQVTDKQFKLIQAIFNLSRNGHPSTGEMVDQARPLIETGLVALEGDSDLSVPPEAQQALARNNRALRGR